MSASIVQIAQKVEQLGTPGLELLNLWLALWAQLTGRPVVRSRWGMMPLPRLDAAGRVVGGYSDAQAAAVAVALAGRKDGAAAAEASAVLEQLERDGALPMRGVVPVVVAVIGLVGSLISAGAAIYAAKKEADAQEQAAGVVAQTNAAKAELERARIEAEERAAKRSQLVGLAAVGLVLVVVFGGGHG